VKIGTGAVAVERWKNPPPPKKKKKKKKKRRKKRNKKPSKYFDAQFRAYGEKKPLEGS